MQQPTTNSNSSVNVEKQILVCGHEFYNRIDRDDTISFNKNNDNNGLEITTTPITEIIRRQPPLVVVLPPHPPVEHAPTNGSTTTATIPTITTITTATIPIIASITAPTAPNPVLGNTSPHFYYFFSIKEIK
ncbi:hypothetical protein ACTFIU_008227 [Dictyostelium citrinum]